jgi:hypothetical protein
MSDAKATKLSAPDYRSDTHTRATRQKGPPHVIIHHQLLFHGAAPAAPPFLVGAVLWRQLDINSIQVHCIIPP